MAERVMELVILVLMASLISLTLTHRPLWIARLTVLVALGVVGGTAFLLALPWIDRSRPRLVARLPFSERAKDRLHHIAASVTLAVSGLRDPLRLLRFCTLTALVWTLDATAAMILARAIGMHLRFAVALLLSTGLALGNALPSTPGAVGIVQFAAVTVLVPFGFTRTDAIAFILGAQATTYVVITALGLIGLWQCRIQPLARHLRSRSTS
jgi:hypothetical protein